MQPKNEKRHRELPPGYNDKLKRDRAEREAKATEEWENWKEKNPEASSEMKSAKKKNIFDDHDL